MRESRRPPLFQGEHPVSEMRQGVFVLYVTYYNKFGYYCVIVLYAVD